MNFGNDASVNSLFRTAFALLLLVNISRPALPVVVVEGQPLGANVARLIQGLDFLGVTLPAAEVQQIKAAIEKPDAVAIQKIIAPHMLAGVSLNPEVRVKVQLWPVKAVLRQGGFTPFLVKGLNDRTVARPLRVGSPKAVPVYSGAALGILRQQALT